MIWTPPDRPARTGSSPPGSGEFPASRLAGVDIRSALEDRLGITVVYNNDGNAAALYAHYRRLGAEAAGRSSVSVIVGTGLGAG